MRKRLGITRLVAAAIGAVTVAGGAYAFTASNTVPTSLAGSGTGTISGYVVSAVHYNLNASNPQNIDSVTFTLDVAPAAGGAVKVKLVAAGSTYFSCTNVTTAVTCTTTGATVATADQLLVVAAQ